jgi:hypothetical protein
MSRAARANIIAEGQTEETFIRELLSPHLSERGVYVAVRRVETSRAAGRIRRGGMTRYTKAKRDIQRWLKEDSQAHLTTMFDLYGLPADFPGLGRARKVSDAYEKVSLIEEALAADIGHRRFIP